MTAEGEKPLLLIDVDGVLNPRIGLVAPVPEPFVEYRDPVIRLALAPLHGAWLLELGELFELTWATSWEADANRVIGPRIGLPPLPHIELRDVDQPGTWKLGAVRRFVGDRAAAWIDDDLGLDVEEWAMQRQAPTFLVRTDPRIGFLREHVDALAEFARGVGPAAERV